MSKQQFIPDANGTIAVKGHEELADAFVLKDRFFKTLESELAETKSSIRSLAKECIAKAAEGAKRIFIRGEDRGGVSVTIPDYTQEGNRNKLSTATLKAITKAGGFEELGVPAEEILDTVVEPGGETLMLRGRWLEWFKTNLVATGKVQLEGDPDLEFRVIEPSTVQKLRYEGISKLRALLAANEKNAVAKLILESSLKEPMVKAEEK